jgi:hypothetical protein
MSAERTVKRIATCSVPPRSSSKLLFWYELLTLAQAFSARNAGTRRQSIFGGVSRTAARGFCAALARVGQGEILLRVHELQSNPRGAR